MDLTETPRLQTPQAPPAAARRQGILQTGASARLSIWKTFFSAHFLAPLACILFGLLISVMPNLVWWAHSGRPVWIADNDELLYLSYASQAYFNHPGHLSDSVFASDRPTHYPWLQLTPAVLLSKLLGSGPLAVSLIWRIWAGVSIAIGWYLLARFYTKRPWIAFALSAILLADVGLVAGRPIVRQLVVTAQVLTGRTQNLLDRNPQVHGEWRIITPGLSLAYLLLHLWLVARAREVPDRKRILAAGAGLGVLFYVYFFYWTAACLALAIAFLMSMRDRDTKDRKVYLYIALVGIVLGLPALLSSFFLKRSASPDWPIRTDLAISIPRFSEFLIPKIALFLLLIMFVWIWKWRKDLVYIWAVAFSALLLSNHQILTGMQTQNFHWTYVWGPSLSFLLILAIADAWGTLTRRWQRAVTLLVVFHCAAGLWLREVESRQTRESVGFTTVYGQYQDQLSLHPARLTPNAVIAGDKSFVDFSVVLNNLRPLDHYAVVMSPSVSNPEWDSRIALNGFLLGLDREAFAKGQREVLANTEWGLEARDPVRRAERLASRLGKYDQVVGDPSSAIAQFNVKYVALGANQAPPEYLRKWRRIEDGPYWQLWERE